MKLPRPDKGDNALVSGSLGCQGQLFARLLADAHTGFAALGQQFLEAEVVALLGYKHMVKTAASGPERLFHRMQTVQDFHEG
jgi:hypothetical protein